MDTGVPLGTTGLILVRISRRSLRVSSYAELMLITYLCLFGTPVGATDLILIQNCPYTEIPLSTTRLKLIP